MHLIRCKPVYGIKSRRSVRIDRIGIGTEISPQIHAHESAGIAVVIGKTYGLYWFSIFLEMFLQQLRLRRFSTAISSFYNNQFALHDVILSVRPVSYPDYCRLHHWSHIPQPVSDLYMPIHPRSVLLLLPLRGFPVDKM